MCQKGLMELSLLLIQFMFSPSSWETNFLDAVLIHRMKDTPVYRCILQQQCVDETTQEDVEQSKRFWKLRSAGSSLVFTIPGYCFLWQDEIQGEEEKKEPGIRWEDAAAGSLKDFFPPVRIGVVLLPPLCSAQLWRSRKRGRTVCTMQTRGKWLASHPQSPSCYVLQNLSPHHVTSSLLRQKVPLSSIFF